MKYIFLVLISLFVSSAAHASNMESDTSYYYCEHEEANEALVLMVVQKGDSLSGYFRGTTDFFDEAREGYYPGYFCLPLQNLKMENNIISFVLNSQNYRFLNRPIEIAIEDSEKRVPEGYGEWLQISKYFWKTVAFVGTYTDNGIILNSSGSKYVFVKTDRKFVEQNYNRNSVDEDSAYENSQLFRLNNYKKR